MIDNEQELLKATELLRSFWNIQKNLMRLVQKSAVENGLSIPQYSIMMTIVMHKVMTQKLVGEKTFLPKSTLSQAVDGLAREGFIERKQVEENRREMMLSLSDKGETLIRTIHMQDGGIHQIFKSVTDSLTSSQYEELLGTHRQISTYLEEESSYQGECEK